MPNARKILLLLFWTLVSWLDLYSQDTTVVTINIKRGEIDTVINHSAEEDKDLCPLNYGPLHLKTLTIRTSNPVKVIFCNYNTAFYSDKAAIQDIDNPDLASYQNLFSQVKPYLGDMVNIIPGAKFGVTASVAGESDEVADKIMKEINKYLDSLSRIRTNCLREISEVSSKDPLTQIDLETVKKNMEPYLTNLQSQPKLGCINPLLEEYRKLGEIPSTKLGKKTEEAVDAQMNQSQKAVSDAHRLQSVVVRLYNINNRKEQVLEKRTTWTTGRQVTISISSSEVMAFAGLDTSSTQYQIKLLPDLLIRPVSAVSVVYWVGDKFNTYAATKQQNSYVITSAEDNTPNFTQGLTFGISWPFLDHRATDGSGWAFSLPEVIVNPFDSFKSFGFGFSFSMYFMKASFGSLLIRNTVLDGMAVGQQLSDASQLKTRSVYVSRPFFGLSFYNLPIFPK